jgi:hypothetical protein
MPSNPRPDDGSFILAENLQVALALAIENLTAREAPTRARSPGWESSMLAAFKMNLEFIRKNGYIHVRT